MEKRGRPFEVGNKLGRGRPRGSRNKRILAVQELLNGHTEGLVRKALVMALQGDAGILRTLLGCVLPRCKDWPANTGDLRTGSTAEIAASYDSVLQRVSRGTLTLGEAQEVAKLLHRRLDLELMAELEGRMRVLEEFQRAAEKSTTTRGRSRK
jgi:hypothetical protein